MENATKESSYVKLEYQIMVQSISSEMNGSLDTKLIASRERRLHWRKQNLMLNSIIVIGYDVASGGLQKMN